jgi:hypothetical protein
MVGKNRNYNFLLILEPFFNMSSKRKSWQEKLLDKKNFPKYLDFEPSFPCGKSLVAMGARPGDKVVLAPPSDVEELMTSVPDGKLITLHEICRELARKYQSDYCCTLTTGIFVMTVANAVEEMKSDGKNNGLPWWRTLKAKGFLNEKYPGGQEKQKSLLEKEGFSIRKKGKRFQVIEYEKYL